VKKRNPLPGEQRGAFRYSVNAHDLPPFASRNRHPFAGTLRRIFRKLKNHKILLTCLIYEWFSTAVPKAGVPYPLGSGMESSFFCGKFVLNLVWK
jgi:hypothetical protein